MAPRRGSRLARSHGAEGAITLEPPEERGMALIRTGCGKKASGARVFCVQEGWYRGATPRPFVRYVDEGMP